MDPNVIPPQQRRKFLMIMLGGLGSVLAGASAWPLFRFLSPPDDSGASSQVSFARDQVKLGGAHLFEYRGRPAVVLQPKAGQYLALSAVCTHLGCVVQWQETQAEFLCPCHGGRFSADGKVLSGPPPKPLESLPLALAGDQIMVG